MAFSYHTCAAEEPALTHQTTTTTTITRNNASAVSFRYLILWGWPARDLYIEEQTAAVHKTEREGKGKGKEKVDVNLHRKERKKNSKSHKIHTRELYTKNARESESREGRRVSLAVHQAFTQSAPTQRHRREISDGRRPGKRRSSKKVKNQRDSKNKNKIIIIKYQSKEIAEKTKGVRNRKKRKWTLLIRCR